MKRIHHAKKYLVALTLALPAAGCSGAGMDEDIEARIGSDVYAIDDYAANVVQAGSVTRIVLSSFRTESCSIADSATSFSAQINIADVADVPLGTAIDIEDPMAPVQVTVDAGTADCGFSGGAERKVHGTVTFTSLSASSAQGSVDLRIDGAVSDCGVSSPTSIEYRWSSFAAPSSHDSCE